MSSFLRKAIVQPLLQFVFLSISISLTWNASAQISGVKTIPGDYPTLSAAIQDVRSQGINGPTTLELQSSYNSNNDVFPIVIREIPGASPASPLRINPASDASDVLIRSFDGGPVIQLIGASYVQIDGRPGGLGSTQALTIRSSSFFAGALALSIVDGASYNSIKYCKLESATQIQSPFGSVVYFGESGDPLPVGVLISNTGNQVSDCIIRSINHQSDGISALVSQSLYNEGNSILNNHIVNFVREGIHIGSTDFSPGLGNINWTISGNSIFQETEVITGHQYGISAINILNATISGNFIGGTAPNAGGNKWRTKLNFNGIRLTNDPNSDPTGTIVVENNVIQNVEITEGADGGFIGIYATFKCALRISGNQVGGTSEANNVNVTGNDKVSRRICMSISGCANYIVENNRISYINFDAGLTHDFSTAPNYYCYGIYYQESNISVQNNQIDHITVANNFGPSSFFGINPFHSTPACLNNLTSTFNSNLLHNIAVSSPEDTAMFIGVGISARIALNDGNVIGSASESNSISVSGKFAIAKGVVVNGEAENVSVNGDVIANITATGTQMSSINGIEFSGRGVVKISNNHIHHLNSPGAKGIYILPLNGPSTTTLEKNIITGVSTSTGTGVEAWAVSEASLNFVAKENTVSGWQTGFLVASSPGGSFLQTFESNSITGNQTGMNNQTGASQNATCNWWGSPSGPSGAGPGTGNPVGPNIIFSPWATIPSYVAVNAGADKTIYIGFGDQKVKLTPTVTVCGTPQYLWSNGAITPTITVNPSVTTNYTVTVKDANGHQASDQVTVVVKDIRCGVFDLRVKVCHTGLFGRKETLCVFPIAAAVHLLHGDVLGDCSSAANNNSAPAQMGVERISSENAVEGISISAYPNPSSHSFTLNFRSSNAEQKITVQVFDLYGRIIETKTNINSGSSLRIGENYKAGSYIVRIINGKEQKQIKLIKVVD